MKRVTQLYGLFILVCCSFAANAGSISGEDFLDLSAKDKGWYFVGALEAMKETREAYFKASELDAAEFDRVWQSCISGKSIRQHLAMFEAWLNAHPDRWHESAIKLLFDSKRASCERTLEEPSQQ